MKKLFLLLCIIYSLSLTAQIPNTWAPSGIGGGGSLFAPSINPANDSEFYISSDLSAIYHTTNAGGSYNILNGQQIQGSHNSTICFTSTPDLLYSLNYSYNNGTLPVVSSDNGNTWTTLAGNPEPDNGATSINVDYNNPNHVVVGCYDEVYFSRDGGNTFNPIHPERNNNAGCLIAGVFFNGNTIYISTNDALLFSTNGGTSFATLATTGIAGTDMIYSFSGAITGDTMRFYCLTGDSNNIYNGLPGSDYYGLVTGVYSMDNASGKWASKLNGIDLSSDYMVFTGTATNNISTCYLAGGSAAGVPDVLKTTDGGNSWTHVFNTSNNQNITTGWCGDGGDLGWDWAESPFGLAVGPNNANYALFGDFGFITRTADGGATWEQAYERPADDNPAGAPTPDKKSYHPVGMENTTCWQVYWIDSLNMYGAYSDIFAVRSTDGGNSWSFNYSYSPSNTIYRITHNISNSQTLYAATSTIHDMYQTYKLTDAQVSGGGEIIFSTDGGATWTNMHNFNAPVYWIATDPNNSNTAYASVIEYGGVGGIYVCKNLSSGAASTWTELPAPPRTQGHPATIEVLNNGNVLCSFSGRRASNAFTQSSGVFLYSVSGGTWTDVSAPDMEYYTRSVTVDPNDATQQTWYACVFNGYGGNGNGDHGVYKTTNGGTSWTLIFNQADIFSCDFSPTNPDLLYVCTDGNGLWASSNVNDATPTFNIVDSYLFANPVRVFFNPYNQNEMWVSTFGYGMNVGTTSTSTGVDELRVSGLKFQVYPNPGSGVFNVVMDNVSQGQLSVYNMLGEIVYQSVITQPNSEIDLSNVPSGIYFLQVMDGGKIFNGKVVKE